MRMWIGLIALGVLAGAADFPETELSNGKVHAKLHLPDGEKGSYQGTRFDWAGIIYSLEYNGHQYFGKWYDKHEVKGHDSITGTVEEFDSIGYAEAKPGGTFVRIGVGTVRKPAEQEYGRFKTYEIVDAGTRGMKKGKDYIIFTHKLSGANSYDYAKTIRLTKTGFMVAHALRNTSDRTMETEVYNHNFFVIDNEVVGPEMVVKFGFDPKPLADLKGMATIEGRELHYARELQKGESVFTEFQGYGKSASDYNFEIQNKKSGAGVKIHADRPLSKVIFWSINTVACPEPYVALKIEPGKTANWTITYDLY